jgi:hypothetical protein
MNVHIDRAIGEQEAVLLMNDCPSHIIAEVTNFLAAARVWVIIFAQYTPQIFQPLDLTLVGIFKREGQYR